jgi:hypothetical protein
MLGMHVVWKEKAIADDARAAKAFLNVRAGRLESPLVGRDHDRVAAKSRREDAGSFMADTATDRELARVACSVQSTVDQPLFLRRQD